MSNDQLKILLVEDDPIQAEIIGSMLSLMARDIIFDVSFSLKETLPRLKEAEYDLILLDLELPDCEGIETFRSVHRAAPNIPIVVLTATGKENLAQETLRGGAQDYLIKWEMDQHLLVRAIRHAIARKSSEEESRNLQSIGRDVTEQKITQRRHREDGRRLKLALDAAGMGIWEWDIGKNRIYCDEKAAELFGVRDGGLDQLLAAIHPDDQASARNKIDQVIRKGINNQTEFRIGSPQGHVRWIECHARMFCGKDKQSKRLLCAVRDITEKKRFEAELYRSRRLESIGALASGIAHDLNNVMAPIFMALHTLQQRFTDDNSQRWLSLVYKSVERGRDLIQQMLTFAKGSSGNMAPLQLHPLIADLENMLNETLPPQVKLKVEIPDDLWTIIGDVTQLYQILINLSINAEDAMPDGGTMTISGENVELDEDKINLIDNAVPGAFIRINVSDTGAGIPPDIIDKIFDPFFTTKEKGLSSGLGLSIVLGIVRGYGGFVNVESDVGKGTTFNIYLPAQKSLKVDSGATLTPIFHKGRGETILVVDDEEYICEVIKNTLECNGYTALVASDGEEAIILFQQNREAIKVVLTDLELPNRDGLTTIREIKRLSPEVVIIATSSIRSTDKLIMAKQAGINTFLSKPYTAEKLLGTLTTLLGHHGDAA